MESLTNTAGRHNIALGIEPADWDDKPFFPVSVAYKKQFGSKVFKIPVSIAEDCPNRRGIGGMQTCIFCDEWGSFAYPENSELALREQIVAHRAKVAKRFNTEKFIVYFQAYTSTFTKLTELRMGFDIALESPDVVGLTVGTRPDCLSEGVLRTWKEYSEKTFMSVEFGVQSFDDDQLIWMRRGHTASQSIKAIERVAAARSIDIGIHLIFGFTGETDKQIIETAKLCNKLPISNVKLHNLHILKNTPLENLYIEKKFVPLEKLEYAHRVGLFLDYLSPNIAVHRLVALASRWDELVAPPWTRDKMRSYQEILDYLRTNGHMQGKMVPEKAVDAVERAAIGIPSIRLLS